MITVEQKEVLRRQVLVDGMSVRGVARLNHCSRETVKQALVDPSPAVYRLKEARKCPVMDPFREIIDEWLLADQDQPRKQRHTAHRIYTRLCAAPYDFMGGEPTVRRFVRERKAVLGLDQPAAFIPLAYGPGQDAQFDFGEAQVVIAGQRLTAQYMVLTLCYSTLPFVMAFPHQRQEALFEGHVAAFEFLGGVPHRIWYDNLTQAVQRILGGHNRLEQQAFIALRSHHLFEARFCNPRQGHEKGLVEALVGHSRRNFMVPVPEAGSWPELNAYLRACCEREKAHRRRGESQTIGERWAAERPALLPLPGTPFESCVAVVGHVNKERLVAFDGNFYSVPLNPVHPRLNVVVKAFVQRVVISCQGQDVAEHPRCYDKGQEVLDPLHYLDLLEQRPRAFEHAKPIRQWRDRWPATYERYLAQLRQRFDEAQAVRRFVQVLQLHREFPAADVERAVQRALEAECFHVDGVRHLLLAPTEPLRPPEPLELAGRPELHQVPVQAPDLARYNRLVAQAA
ncbi:MAG: IS21 family transposase [Nitrososphaerales archaeon]